MRKAKFRISNIQVNSAFEQEIGLAKRRQKKQEYVPEVMTASDNIDLIYDNITNKGLKSTMVKMGQRLTTVFVMICVFFASHLIYDYMQGQGFGEINLANLQGYISQTTKNLIEAVIGKDAMNDLPSW